MQGPARTEGGRYERSASPAVLIRQPAIATARLTLLSAVCGEFSWLFPQTEGGRHPERQLEVGRFSRRSDSDDEVEKAAVAPSIRAADEQDTNLSGLRRGGQ